MAVVEFQSIASRNVDVQPFVFDPDFDENESNPFRVRHLIEKLVSETVRDFHLREKERAFQFLTPESIAKGVKTGKIGSPREERQHVDVDLAIGQALQAFEDGLYLLFVDQVEKKSLEELVSVQPDTTITIIRLTALAGQ